MSVVTLVLAFVVQPAGNGLSPSQGGHLVLGEHVAVAQLWIVTCLSLSIWYCHSFSEILGF